MKIHFFKIAALILVTLCNSGKNQIQETWIGKHRFYLAQDNRESFAYSGLRKILKIGEDQVAIKNFIFNIEDSNELKSFPYQIDNDELVIFGAEATDSFEIRNVYEDSLILFHHSNSRKKLVFEKMPKFNQASREKEFYGFLTSNTFYIQDTVDLEFRKNSYYVSRNFKVGVGSNQYWMLDRFENELFLVLDAYYGGVFHLQYFDSEKIVTRAFGKEIIFRKGTTPEGFEVSQMIGKWERETAFPSIPPPIETERDFFEKELLEITASEIRMYNEFRKDTIGWELNRGNDIIIFGRNRYKWRLRQWNILSVDDEYLTIQRNRKIGFGKDRGIQIVRFKKIVN